MKIDIVTFFFVLIVAFIFGYFKEKPKNLDQLGMVALSALAISVVIAVIRQILSGL